MAGAAAHYRRSLLYLLITYGKPRNPPQRGGADRRAPRATDRLPRPTADRAVGHRIEVGRKTRRPRQLLRRETRRAPHAVVHGHHTRGGERQVRDRESGGRRLRFARGFVPGLRLADYPGSTVVRSVGRLEQ